MSFICNQAARLARNYEHAIIDTNARPEPEEISELVQGCDLLIIPTTPDALSLQALQMTTNAIEKAKGNNYKVLLTIIPPKPNRDGEEMRSETYGEGNSPVCDRHSALHCLSKGSACRRSRLRCP